MKPPKVIQQIGEVLDWSRQVVACLERQLTLEENHRGELKRVQGWDPVSFPQELGCSLPTVPVEVRVLSASQRDGNGIRTSGNKVTWSWVPGPAVRISAIEGLTNGVLYDLVLWIGGG